MIPGMMTVSLTRSEFAAVRAYVQGMPAAMVVPRYLADESDDDEDGAESSLRILLALRDRMVQLAHLHGRADLAELLLAGPGRSNRGMDRRVDALAELERLGTAAPRPQHGVELWFAPALARRLRKAEIVTLNTLFELANQRGSAWWRVVPRIGALAGAAVNRWLSENRAAFRDPDGKPLLGAHVGNRTLIEQGGLGPGMRQPLPLEWMTASPASEPDACCPYSQGLDVVQAWLRDAAGDNGSTFSAYRKEAERLLLWAALERRKGLSQLDLDDRWAYLGFLAQPEPASRWCGPRAPRHLAAWRPFTGPLSPASVRHSMRVLAALFRWMHANGYPGAALWPAQVPDGTDASAATAAAAQVPAASLAPFLSWLERRGGDGDGQRYRTAHAAILLLREHRLSLDRLTSVTRRSLAQMQPPAWSSDDGMGSTTANGMPGFGATTQHALVRHWHDRNLQWDGAGTEDASLIGPPAPPPTRRAQRKLAALPQAGYSVRGLHALLSSMLERYRKTCDQEFGARSPRDLLA
ncbi:phage integrase family protein [Cupriavidus sp. BIC8F]|uniref:phage integrase family protein n=1 Tax=Cupriavidus sp. BIC8F TaxID=3079014 RepID=UPI0029161D53|nr:phage integrase family protein [Cupriavidus sp. BIC8F]